MQVELGRDVLALEVDMVVGQISGHGARADLHIAAVGTEAALARGCVHALLGLATVGVGDLDSRERGQRPFRRDHRLRVEDDDDLRPVVHVGVEIPPLVAGLVQLGAQAVLPRFDDVPLEAELLEVGIVPGLKDFLRCGHGASPFPAPFGLAHPLNFKQARSWNPMQVMQGCIRGRMSLLSSHGGT